MILLNPGPVNVSERVRRALMQSDMCHRENEFSVLQEAVRQGLLAVYGLPKARYTSVILTGSGTAAVEAMVTSIVPPNGKLLMLKNGVYGERIAAIAKAHGIAFTMVEHEWGQELDRYRIEEALKSDPAISHIAAIHHETTTGRLNDLGMISELARTYGKVLLIDGVSSFGGEELNFDEWNIGAVCATANKCLHGIPGISFVVVRRELLEQIDFQPRSVYLDLRGYYREQERGGTPFTQTVQVLYALDEALREFQEQGGWRARHEKYRQLAQYIRTRAQELGIKMYLEEGMLASTLTAFRLPHGMSYQTLHDHLKAAGFIIYAGQGEAGKVMFRIANMGEIEKTDIDRLFVAMQEVV
ncbi:2-aminoethylphosphonate--pyruvate transaminase [Candidatus Uhrbacteria bacterium]|nr:2-aminoethylphosphonate--pyruvate transaminase [Candidatus Uhrbacteria bacterium]